MTAETGLVAPLPILRYGAECCGGFWGPCGDRCLVLLHESVAAAGVVGFGVLGEWTIGADMYPFLPFPPPHLEVDGYRSKKTLRAWRSLRLGRIPIGNVDVVGFFPPNWYQRIQSGYETGTINDPCIEIETEFVVGPECQDRAEDS